MQWTGNGLIVGVRRHGEGGVIVEAMVEERGRCMGLVRGGRSHKQAPALQAGNTVQLVWRARLDEHLGTFVVELLEARAARMIGDRARLYALQLLCDHFRLLPERDPHDRLLGLALDIIDGEGDPRVLGSAVARFELILLDELGFGLDLESCAVTGRTTGLTHVSPKTGRAVTREAALPYVDRLLALPGFLKTGSIGSADDIAEGFTLTGHFLERHVWGPRQIERPATRDGLIGLVTG
jgi:DNA repair protein RecO (recombination protein O)